MPHTREQAVQSHYGRLIGLTVVGARHLSPEELADIGWEHTSDLAVVLMMSDGTLVVPSADPEGNSPGHLFLDF